MDSPSQLLLRHPTLDERYNPGFPIWTSVSRIVRLPCPGDNEFDTRASPGEISGDPTAWFYPSDEPRLLLCHCSLRHWSGLPPSAPTPSQRREGCYYRSHKWWLNLLSRFQQWVRSGKLEKAPHFIG